MATLAKIIGTSAFLFWATVVPHGQEFCQSSQGFRYNPQNENGQQARREARAAFCALVKANPL